MLHVIITAAGSGSRFGAPLPKQFCLLAGRPVLMHTIESVAEAMPDANIVLTLSKDAQDLWRRLCNQYDFVSPQVVTGGDTRFHSIKNGLMSLQTEHDDIIMVHDGARPFVTYKMCQRLIDSTLRYGSAVPTVAVTDSLRRIYPDGTNRAVDRARYRAVETPQAFRADILLKAYSADYIPEFTDDASVVEADGHSVSLVEGDPSNIKITHPIDLVIAEAIINNKQN